MPTGMIDGKDFSPKKGDVTMTMPKERTRALRLAGELLREVMHSSKCPESLRCQAQTILRHYPSALDIAHQAKQCDPQGRPFCWLGPENREDEPG